MKPNGVKDLKGLKKRLKLLCRFEKHGWCVQKFKFFFSHHSLLTHRYRKKGLKKKRDQANFFLGNGLVRMDNNMIENAIRPFVIGGKNWLFSVSPEGARASALFYSLIETAKANGLEPSKYLQNLFDKLPNAKTSEDVFYLLPMNMSKIDLK